MESTRQYFPAGAPVASDGAEIEVGCSNRTENYSRKNFFASGIQYGDESGVLTQEKVLEEERRYMGNNGSNNHQRKGVRSDDCKNQFVAALKRKEIGGNLQQYSRDLLNLNAGQRSYPVKAANSSATKLLYEMHHQDTVAPENHEVMPQDQNFSFQKRQKNTESSFFIPSMPPTKDAAFLSGLNSLCRDSSSSNNVAPISTTAASVADCETSSVRSSSDKEAWGSQSDEAALKRKNHFSEAAQNTRYRPREYSSSRTDVLKKKASNRENSVINSVSASLSSQSFDSSSRLQRDQAVYPPHVRDQHSYKYDVTEFSQEAAAALNTNNMHCPYVSPLKSTSPFSGEPLYLVVLLVERISIVEKSLHNVAFPFKLNWISDSGHVSSPLLYFHGSVCTIFEKDEGKYSAKALRTLDSVATAINWSTYVEGSLTPLCYSSALPQVSAAAQQNVQNDENTALPAGLLRLSLTYGETNECLGLAVLHLSDLGTSDTFQRFTIELLAAGGTFAVATVFAASQRRWVKLGCEMFERQVDVRGSFIPNFLDSDYDDQVQFLRQFIGNGSHIAQELNSGLPENPMSNRTSFSGPRDESENVVENGMNVLENEWNEPDIKQDVRELDKDERFYLHRISESAEEEHSGGSRRTGGPECDKHSSGFEQNREVLTSGSEQNGSCEEDEERTKRSISAFDACSAVMNASMAPRRSERAAESNGLAAPLRTACGRYDTNTSEQRFPGISTRLIVSNENGLQADDLSGGLLCNREQRRCSISSVTDQPSRLTPMKRSEYKLEERTECKLQEPRYTQPSLRRLEEKRVDVCDEETLSMCSEKKHKYQSVANDRSFDDGSEDKAAVENNTAVESFCMVSNVMESQSAVSELFHMPPSTNAYQDASPCQDAIFQGGPKQLELLDKALSLCIGLCKNVTSTTSQSNELIEASDFLDTLTELSCRVSEALMRNARPERQSSSATAVREDGMTQRISRSSETELNPRGFKSYSRVVESQPRQPEAFHNEESEQDMIRKANNDSDVESASTTNVSVKGNHVVVPLQKESFDCQHREIETINEKHTTASIGGLGQQEQARETQDGVNARASQPIVWRRSFMEHLKRSRDAGRKANYASFCSVSPSKQECVQMQLTTTALRSRSQVQEQIKENLNNDNSEDWSAQSNKNRLLKRPTDQTNSECQQRFPRGLSQRSNTSSVTSVTGNSPVSRCDTESQKSFADDARQRTCNESVTACIETKEQKSSQASSVHARRLFSSVKRHEQEDKKRSSSLRLSQATSVTSYVHSSDTEHFTAEIDDAQRYSATQHEKQSSKTSGSENIGLPADTCSIKRSVKDSEMHQDVVREKLAHITIGNTSEKQRQQRIPSHLEETTQTSGVDQPLQCSKDDNFPRLSSLVARPLSYSNVSSRTSSLRTNATTVSVPALYEPTYSRYPRCPPSPMKGFSKEYIPSFRLPGPLGQVVSTASGITEQRQRNVPATTNFAPAAAHCSRLRSTLEKPRCLEHPPSPALPLRRRGQLPTMATCVAQDCRTAGPPSLASSAAMLDA